nr:DUF4235 domain-containing protein [Kineosporia mesophila]
MYKPFGLAGSVGAGLIAGVLFKQVWKHVSDADDTPEANDRRFGWGQVLLAATVQGAIFAAVKAAVDRGGAVAFERWTGEWPGEE